MKKARDLLKTLGSCRIRRSSNLVALDRMEDSSNRYSYDPTLQWNPQVHDYFVKAYGADHFSRISKSLTRPSGYSCVRVNTLRSTSDEVIAKLQAVMNKSGSENDLDSKRCSSEANNIRDLEFSGNIALGQSEDKANPSKACSRAAPVSKCHIPGLDYVVFVQGSGPHKINYDFAHDRPPKEVLVSRKCAEAVLRGAQVYVPGVMACSAHVETGDTVAVSVAVEQPGVSGGWGIGMTRGTVLQGSQTDPYYSERSGLYIGQGTTMMSRAGMFRVSKGVALDMRDRVYELPSFHNVLEGDIFLQNLPSIVTAHALDPQKGERILDMCAAPGGKTTAIAILMKDEGEIIAADRSHNKVMDIQKLAAEMGLSCIKTYKLDALKAVCQRNEPDNLSGSYCGNADNGVTDQVSDSSILNEERMSSIGINRLNIEKTMEENVDHIEEENKGTYVSKAEIRKSMRRERNGPGRNQCLGGRVEKSKGFPPNSFDKVLLDAPCSALGLRPRLFAGEETIESLRTHAKYQRRMFDQAVQLARAGGVIVYSTCTINPGENEALVRYALDTYKYLSLAHRFETIYAPFQFPFNFL
ncbi:rRNA (cytosine-C(5))-methyltransferase NOP2C-like isoform X2 [Prosopis cineraria]|uniref:rRNA (cytosine-C(5))-methyltransferase NOP2C-like isoform X2 n=1 Tax=Prosopis cineraria TaxID=364024 RepID=UPI0024105E59|nr:rRNA (cytosine-C(5))-methyltransferase NOP2C-like isoform X2 [Prosopis cineraria]